MQRSQKMREGPVGDVHALPPPHHVVESKMDAFVDTSVHNIICGVREAAVWSRIERDPGNGTRDCEFHFVSSKEIRERGRGSASSRARSGRVTRVVWCHDKRHPGGEASRLEVSILFAFANRRNGPPEIPAPLRGPRVDDPVCQRHVEQGKQSGSVTDVAHMHRRESPCRPVPVLNRIVGKEQRYIGLLWSASTARETSQPFDFVVILRVLAARQVRWRRRGAELVGIFESERRDGREKCCDHWHRVRCSRDQRGWPPFAWIGPAQKLFCIRWRTAVVVRTQAEDVCSSLMPCRQTLVVQQRTSFQIVVVK